MKETLLYHLREVSECFEGMSMAEGIRIPKNKYCELKGPSTKLDLSERGTVKLDFKKVSLSLNF
jgi:hypothetical protein